MSLQTQAIRYVDAESYLMDYPGNPKSNTRDLARILADIDKKIWSKRPHLIPHCNLFGSANCWTHLTMATSLQFLLFKGWTVIGLLSLMQVKEEDLLQANSWETLTENGSLLTHDDNGDCIFPVRMSISPKEIKNGNPSIEKIYTLFIDHAFRQSVLKLDLKSVIAATDILSWQRFSHQINPQEYVQSFFEGRIQDPQIQFFLERGFKSFEPMEIRDKFLPGSGRRKKNGKYPDRRPVLLMKKV